jgi:hypothetical protein
MSKVYVDILKVLHTGSSQEHFLFLFVRPFFLWRRVMLRISFGNISCSMASSARENRALIVTTVFKYGCVQQVQRSY